MDYCGPKVYNRMPQQVHETSTGIKKCKTITGRAYYKIDEINSIFDV